MTEYKLVISDPKGKKAYQIEVKSPEAEAFLGKKIGDKIKGDSIKVSGFEFEITGGSDKQGFPMRKDVMGIKRQKMMVGRGPGFKPKRKGQRKRKSIRGNQIAEDISQINLKVVGYGSKPLGVALGKEEEAKPEEKPEEAKPEEKKEEKPEETKPEDKSKAKSEEKPKEEKESAKKEESGKEDKKEADKKQDKKE